MIKDLPISTAPPLSEIQTNALPLSVLAIHPSFSDKWLLQNFPVFGYKRLFATDQIILSHHISHFRFFFFWKCFRKKIILYYPHKEIIKSIKKALDNDYYVFIGGVNERYIPERVAYQKYDKVHELLIFGYDSNSFRTIAYNNKGLYKANDISYAIFNQALLGCSSKYLPTKIAFKVKDHYDFNKLNHKKFKKNLRKSLTKKKIGVDAFNYFIRDAQTALESNTKLDIRSFKTVYEHARIMSSAQKYFTLDIKNKELLCAYEELSNATLVLAVKYNITKKASLRLKISDHIQQLKEIEKKCVMCLLNNV